MGRTVYAEENILSYLKELTSVSASCTGLLLGQSSSSKDYVVLLVRTPDQSDSEIQMPSHSPATFQSVKEIKESWIADHAKHVTKMLPGGMWVLGIFICCPNNIFSDSGTESKIKSILSALKKQLCSEPLLNANSPSTEKLILHFNASDSQYTCKTYDFNIMNTFKSADWKFQNNYTKWCKIQCNFDLSQPTIGSNMSHSLKEQLKMYLKEINKSLEKAMIILNGQMKNSEDILEVLLKNNASRDSKIPQLRADIFLPCKKNGTQKSIVVKDCDVELHLLGALASQVYVSQKSSVAEAINAIKQDIVRSLTTRFEMHWDSLVEEEYGSPEEKLSVHEPPRRVVVTLPNGIFALNDYLFPGEGAAEVVSSFKEMLDIEISEANMESEIEIQGDSMEFYGKAAEKFSNTTHNELLRPSIPKGFFILSFSVVVILVAIAIGLFIQDKKK